MHVLVTGGAGFIGSHIVDALTGAGHEVRVLDLREPPADAAGDRLVGDVRDAATCDRALEGVDAVCHQAAMVGLGVDLQDLPLYAGHNDLGTAVLLAAMARSGHRDLVLASSMVVYGDGAYRCAEHGEVAAAPRREADLAAGRFEPGCPVCGEPLEPGLVGEDAAMDPRSVYAATKLAQEHLTAAWARGSGSRAVALRYHNVYGPRMPRDTPYAGVASLFRSELAAGRVPRVFEDGGQRRDFVHVRDIAAANVAALLAVTGGEPGAVRPYNVGSGTVRTVLDMARALGGVHGGVEPVVTGEFRLGDVRHITASSERIRAELGWAPAEAFADGMAEFAAAGTA